MTDGYRFLARGVVVVPGSRFPAILIMGDTLASIASDIDSGLKALRETAQSGVKYDGDIDALEYALSRICERLDAYEKTLAENNISIPYETRPEA